VGIEGSLLDALLAVHDVLEAEDVEHALCGGLAANLYRDELRATVDLDIYLVSSPAQLVSTTRAFEEHGWTAHPAWRQAELLRLERADLPRVDLLIASTDFERIAVRRASEALIAGRNIRVLTPEDLIIFKLAAGRLRDYEDVVAMLNARTGRIDAGYVRRWLDEFGMTERWTRALEEAKREAEDLG
jgi:predicted nucleotidyltransferase